jgi:hypothetical protein
VSGHTYAALGRLGRPLQARHRAAWFALVLGGGLLVLGAAAWLARLGIVGAPLWIPAAWLVVLGVIVTGMVRAVRSAVRFTPRAIGAWLEEQAGWRRGMLSGQLEPAVAGTSMALHALADTSAATDVDARGGTATAPLADAVRSRLRGGALLLLAGSVLLVSARPWQPPAARVWHPATALRDATRPVRIIASADAIDRDGTVTLQVEAPGRASAVLYTRAPGDTWMAHHLALDSAGRAGLRLGPLAADLFAHATSGGRGSDTIEVRVRLPAFLGALTVTAHYPGYLGLADEPLPTTGDTIPLPAGTRLLARGRATAALRSATWTLGGAVYPLAVGADSFSGAFAPRASGVYTLELVTAEGAPLGGEPAQLALRVVPDSAPVIAIPLPGADTVAPLSMRLPLVVDARDDHALTGVRIVRRWRGRQLADTLALPSGSDHAVLPVELDLTDAQPGDTVIYRAIATDNAPARQAGQSPEYRVRIPTVAELRAAQREASAEIATSLDSLARRSADVQRQTEDLSRERTRASRDSTGNQPALSFEQARQAQALAEATEALQQQSEQMREALDALRQAAEQAGLTDPEFQQRLAEVREQLAKALTPELRAKLAELKTALQQLDAEQARRALQDLTEAQAKLRDALERSQELFKRAALEGELASLAEEAKALAKEQESWNAAAQTADSARAANDERQMGERADSLASQLAQAAHQFDSSSSRTELERTAQQAAQAAQQMQQAAQQMSQGNRASAGQHGKQASQMLGPLGGQLDSARKSAQDSWREEVMKALDQSLAETSRLARRELDLSGALSSGLSAAEARVRQAELEDGLRQVVTRIRDIAGKNALVSQQIGVALEAARAHMADAREAVASANLNVPAAVDRTGSAVDALNAAAYLMLRSRNDVSGSASGSGMAEAMERMSQLAGQQGQLGQQTATLMPVPGQGQGQATGSQLMQLAARQRAIAEELQRLQAGGNMPAAGQLGDEAQDLARRLEAGRLDRQTVERQQQLFRRMLDAGRTLQGEQPDEQKERKSTTAKDDNVQLPPALRQRLGQGDAAPQVPGWDELQRLSPEERRLVLDYFRRLSEGTGP